jgi:hypothetical protein
MSELSPEEHDNPVDMSPDDLRLTPDDTLEVTLRAFDTSGLARIAVFDSNNMENQVGWADYTRALSTFNAALIEANVEEHR